MTNTFEGFTFYRSTFDLTTGTLVRETEQPTGRDRWDRFENMLTTGLPWELRRPIKDKWQKRFNNRKEAFSPSPETIDISITDHCGFSCNYCYMDSTSDKKHARSDLVERVIRSFDVPPYQIAIGGGEPTTHPNLPAMLYRARELGVVPNYTTAGHVFRDDVIEATNAACGGIAMTYHAFKGIDWFVEHYLRLRKALRVQMNVHLIADRDAAVNLEALTRAQEKLGRLHLVLLAFYPNVGRASLQGLITKHVYNHTLPGALKRAIESGMRVAFSEGLLPYFISRPEIGVSTKMQFGGTEAVASRSEGLFSCYVDPRGRMSQSSFDPPPSAAEYTLDGYRQKQLQQALESRYRYDRSDAEIKENFRSFMEGSNDSVYETRLQHEWNEGWWQLNEPDGLNCHDCVERDRCSVPNIHHYFICRYSEVNDNNPPLTEERKRAVAQNNEWSKACAEMDAKKRELGRDLTEEEKDLILVTYRALMAKDDVSRSSTGGWSHDDGEPKIVLSKFWQRRLRYLREKKNRKQHGLAGKRKKCARMKWRRQKAKQYGTLHDWIDKKAKRREAARRRERAA